MYLEYHYYEESYDYDETVLRHIMDNSPYEKDHDHYVINAHT